MTRQNANTRQVGGQHYKSNYQHWDFVEDFGIGYLESMAIKYLSRWKKKDGFKDLEKAFHFVEKLLDRIDNNSRASRTKASEEIIAPAVERFIRENNINKAEGEIIDLLATWRSRHKVDLAWSKLKDFLAANEEVKAPAKKAAVSAPAKKAPAKKK